MARRKKKLSPVKKFAIIAGSLIVIEAAFLMLVPAPKQHSAKDAITSAVEKSTSGLDQRRVEQLKVQMALTLYRTKNKGKFPDSLELLVPEYLERLPNDPETNKPFTMTVVDGRAYIGDLPGTKPGTKPSNSGQSISETQLALLQSLDEGDDERARFVYDSTGKRDPFRKFDFRASDPDDANRTEAERYDIGQLKLTGVIQGFEEPLASIENAAGKGMYLKKGDRIGLNRGEITEIQSDRVIIVESAVDFTGEKKSKTVEMRLRTKDQEKK